MKSTPSSGQRPVWCQSPSKRSRPTTSGSLGADRQPVARTQNRAVIRSPPSVIAAVEREFLTGGLAPPDASAVIGNDRGRFQAIRYLTRTGVLVRTADRDRH